LTLKFKFCPLWAHSYTISALLLENSRIHVAFYLPCCPLAPSDQKLICCCATALLSPCCLLFAVTDMLPLQQHILRRVNWQARMGFNIIVLAYYTRKNLSVIFIRIFTEHAVVTTMKPVAPKITRWNECRFYWWWSCYSIYKLLN